MPRKTAKQRKSVMLRFGPDPKQAREERDIFEEAFKKSGEPSRNFFLKKIIMGEVRKRVGRES